MFFFNNVVAEETIPLFDLTPEIAERETGEGIEIIKLDSRGFEKSMGWFWSLFEGTAGRIIGDSMERKSLDLIRQAGFDPEGRDFEKFMADFRKNFLGRKVPEIFEIETRFFTESSAFMRYFCSHVANAQALDCVYNGIGSFSWNGQIIQPLDVAPDVYAHFYMSCPNGQSVRNRYRLVCRLYKEMGGGKTLSVACGSAQALIHASRELVREGREVSLLLSDADQSSLDIAKKRVSQAGIQEQVSYLKSAFFALHNKLGGQKFDCIEMCGIFDYLVDRHALSLLEFALGALNPGGKVIVSNMTNACGATDILRRMYNWEIISRSPEMLGRLIKEAGGRDIKVYVEPWGIHPVATFTD